MAIMEGLSKDMNADAVSSSTLTRVNVRYNMVLK
jgi:hypothetical protein